MSSNEVCNHTRDKQLGIPLRSRQILSLVLLLTKLDSTQYYYHLIPKKLILILYHTQKNLRFLIFNYFKFFSQKNTSLW